VQELGVIARNDRI